MHFISTCPKFGHRAHVQTSFYTLLTCSYHVLRVSLLPGPTRCSSFIKFSLSAPDSTTHLRSLGSFYGKRVFTTLLLLSRFTCARLCATPWTTALQAPLLYVGILQARTLEWVAMPSSSIYNRYTQFLCAGCAYPYRDVIASRLSQQKKPAKIYILILHTHNTKHTYTYIYTYIHMYVCEYIYVHILKTFKC